MSCFGRNQIRRKDIELKLTKDVNDKLRNDMLKLYSKDETLRDKVKEFEIRDKMLTEQNQKLHKELTVAQENVRRLITSRSRYRKKYEKHKESNKLLHEHIDSLKSVISQHDNINIMHLKTPRIIEDPDCESQSMIEN